MKISKTKKFNVKVEDSFSNKEEYMLDKTCDNMANPLDLQKITNQTTYQVGSMEFTKSVLRVVIVEV